MSFSRATSSGTHSIGRMRRSRTTSTSSRRTAARRTLARSRGKRFYRCWSGGSSTASRESGASVRRLQIRVGHSPDPDDAFMYWALTTDLVDTRGHEFEQVLGDIQTLNQWARAARLEVTAISLAAYPFVQDNYALLPHGASIGAGYGPVLVAREPIGIDDLAGREIVIPGTMTTSFLALRLVLDGFRFRELAFDEIPDEVASGRADLGLLIHEGQLTFSELGLAKVLDLGEWWLLETGLPLPLGVNVV